MSRITPTKKEEDAFSTDLVQPIYIGEVPEIVHAAQTNCLQKKNTGTPNMIISEITFQSYADRSFVLIMSF